MNCFEVEPYGLVVVLLGLFLLSGVMEGVTYMIMKY